MAVKLTVATPDGAVAILEIAPGSSLRALCALVAVELAIPAAEQELRFNGVVLRLETTIAGAGLADGDLVLVMRKPPRQRGGPGSHLLERLSGNPAAMEQMRVQRPEMFDAVRRGDAATLERLVRDMQRAFSEGGGASAAGPAVQDVDPYSEEAQRRALEEIRQENVMRNMEAAMEHNPESFGSVVMLFVDCKVNSAAGVKAFVDSGAQTTIISKACAERCNILRLMDTRFEGTARGVGTAKIHGRIHLALLTLGQDVFEVSFTVMGAVGGGYDMLLGLDMLRKHAASIDLRENCLKIGNSAVPFLAEKDIPKQMLSGGGEEDSTAVTKSDGGPGPSGSTPAIGRPVSVPAPTTTSNPPASAPAVAGTDEAVVSNLVELGFPRSDVLQALHACNGNAEEAAAMLTSSRYGF